MDIKIKESLPLVLLLVGICSSDTDSKRASNERVRYEISEGSYGRPIPDNRPIRPPEQYRPDRPSTVNGYRPNPDFSRPTDFGPQTFNRPIDNYYPSNRPIENEYRPGGNGYRPGGNGYRPGGSDYRPGGNGYRPNYQSGGFRPGEGGYRPVNGHNGRPILTGPVPSHEINPHRYKDYDKCKCVHSFNCNSPGIKFGACDIDKQYCCYQISHHDGFGGLGGASHNNYERPRPILAGPGGPIDSHGSHGSHYQNKYNSGRPFRPFSDIDRYVSGSGSSNSDLDEAYKRGLASAIYEAYQRPNGKLVDNSYQGYRDYYRGDRDYYTQDLYRPNQKYGLYDPTRDFYGRSANVTITAKSATKS